MSIAPKLLQLLYLYRTNSWLNYKEVFFALRFIIKLCEQITNSYNIMAPNPSKSFTLSLSTGTTVASLSPPTKASESYPPNPWDWSSIETWAFLFNLWRCMKGATFWPLWGLRTQPSWLTEWRSSTTVRMLRPRSKQHNSWCIFLAQCTCRKDSFG